MSDLELSLQVRQLYAYLRREILAASRQEISLEGRFRDLVYRLVEFRS